MTDQPTGAGARPQQQGPLRPAVPAPSSMGAPSIPNLLGRLGGSRDGGPPRAGRGGRRGFGRGRGSHGRGHGDKIGGGTAVTLDHDTIIQSTDADAALSRLSAVDIGLLDDPFAAFFAGDGGPGPRRLPIINRGTYTRTQALDRIILAFLTNNNNNNSNEHAATPPQRQIVSLGAGTDTRCLRLLARPGQTALRDVVYHEIDFPAVSSKKRRILEAAPALRSLLEGPIEEHALGVDAAPAAAGARRDGSNHGVVSWRAALGRGNELWGHGLDLRALAARSAGATSTPADNANANDDGDGNKNKTNTPPGALAGLRTGVPTLLVSECCLCYLEPATARAVLQYFDAQSGDGGALGVVLYEPIRPNDSFGRTMVANLAARGIAMPTLAAYPDGAAQEARLRQDARLDRVRHRAMDALWDAWVDEREQARVNQLDGLDEVEEWQLLASHYVVAWGSRGAYFETAWAGLDE